MKTLFVITFVLLCFVMSLRAQSIIRSNVGAAGSSQSVTANDKTYYVSQSIGQASVIGTSTQSGHTIRQGFQQPPNILIVDGPLAAEDLLTTIYPNPFSQSVNVAFNEEIDEEVSILLWDITGKIILNKDFQPAQLITVPLETISNGEYILNISSGQRNKTTTIIKR